MWLATLLGGGLAGYAIAIWNGRMLRRHSAITTLLYTLMAIGGWLLTIALLANLTPPSNGEPGFGIPVALGLGFLLVSIPYNRDTLAVNQWIWTHPGRKLVLNLGGKGSGLGFTSFANAQGELFGAQADVKPLLSIPVIPIVIVGFSLAVGVATVVIGNTLAPK